MRQRPRQAGEAAFKFNLLADLLPHVVDDRDGHEDAGARADGAQEVGEDGERADAHAAKGGGRRDVAVEHVQHRLVAEAADHHLLFAQLAGDVAWAGPGDLNPRLGEDRARREHENDVEEGVERVPHDVHEVTGRRDEVRQATDRHGLAALRLLPATEEAHEEVVRVPLVQHLERGVG